LVAAELLGELYGALRLFTNLYQPSFKLKETIRVNRHAKSPPHCILKTVDGVVCCLK
jgi:hypothetical protein